MQSSVSEGVSKVHPVDIGNASILFSKQRINGANEETGFMQRIGYRFVAKSSVFHVSYRAENIADLVQQLKFVEGEKRVVLNGYTDYFTKGRSIVTVLFLLET